LQRIGFEKVVKRLCKYKILLFYVLKYLKLKDQVAQHTITSEPLSIIGNLSILSIIIYKIKKKLIVFHLTFYNFTKNIYALRHHLCFHGYWNLYVYILHTTYVKHWDLNPNIIVYLFSCLWPAWWWFKHTAGLN
jgi:hypothetical protein